MGSYGWFDSTIEGQSHSSDCRFDTCSCWGLHDGETDWGLHDGETAVEAGTGSFSTAGGVHRLSGRDLFSLTLAWGSDYACVM